METNGSGRILMSQMYYRHLQGLLSGGANLTRGINVLGDHPNKSCFTCLGYNLSVDDLYPAVTENNTWNTLSLFLFLITRRKGNLWKLEFTLIFYFRIFSHKLIQLRNPLHGLRLWICAKKLENEPALKYFGIVRGLLNVSPICRCVYTTEVFHTHQRRVKWAFRGGRTE